MWLVLGRGTPGMAGGRTESSKRDRWGSGWRNQTTKSGRWDVERLGAPDASKTGLVRVSRLRPVTAARLSQSKEATTAIIVVFSLLAALLLAVGLVLLVRKLREKRQTEGSYRPSSEEQVGARAPPPPNLKLPPEERLI